MKPPPSWPTVLDEVGDGTVYAFARAARADGTAEFGWFAIRPDTLAGRSAYHDDELVRVVFAISLVEMIRLYLRHGPGAPT